MKYYMGHGSRCTAMPNSRWHVVANDAGYGEADSVCDALPGREPEFA
jgi:hypothetical protein